MQDHVEVIGAAFKVSVVTGPSGSYREDDIIKFLEKWCEPWYNGRQWEFIMLDAYAPGLTNNVQRLCWSRGYIVVTHGGGASMICQTNDVGLHKDVRADFIAKQTEKLLEHARSKRGGLCDLTAEENVSIMCEVMSNKDLHLKAADAYKWTGTTNALDGTEDELIAGDARQFWDELDMRGVNKAMEEVEQEWKAGNLKWGFTKVYSLVGAYPPRGQMDEWRPGMDDEATPDPDPHPYDEDDVPAEEED